MRPEERDAVAIEFAAIRPCLIPSPKAALRGLPAGIRERVASLFLGSTVRDLDALLADRAVGDWAVGDIPAFRSMLDENLALPVNGIAEGGPSVGEALAMAIGMPLEVPNAALMMAALTLYAFMPDQPDAPALMSAMTESRAVEPRDRAVTLQLRGAMPDLSTEPELTGVVLLFLDRVQTAAPGLSAIPRPPGSAALRAVNAAAPV
jgi:hypothetical protein